MIFQGRKSLSSTAVKQLDISSHLLRTNLWNTPMTLSRESTSMFYLEEEEDLMRSVKYSIKEDVVWRISTYYHLIKQVHGILQ